MLRIIDTTSPIVKFFNRIKADLITLFPIIDTPNPVEFDTKSTGVGSFFRKNLINIDTYQYFNFAYSTLVEVVEKLMRENYYRGLKVAEAIVEQEIRSWPERYVGQVIEGIKATYGENIGNIGISKSMYPPSDLWTNGQFDTHLRLVNAAYYDACEVVNKSKRSEATQDNQKEMSDYVSAKTLLIINALKELSKYSISFENASLTPSDTITGEITVTIGLSCARLSIPMIEETCESVEEIEESDEKKETSSVLNSAFPRKTFTVSRGFIMPKREVSYDTGLPFKLYISPLTFGITYITQEVPTF